MRQLTLIITLLFLSSSTIAQKDPGYFIIQTDTGNYLVHGKATLIKQNENSCYEWVENTEIDEGKKYIITRYYDEMYNLLGVGVFDKKGNQIDLQPVQKERAKHYSTYNCCVYVQEYKGKLYFWDIIESGPEGLDYDCSMDSQTDASDYLIPRYYIFDPKKGTVVMKTLQNKCTQLFVDGELSCEE